MKSLARLSAAAGLVALWSGAQEPRPEPSAPPNAPHFVHSVKAPGLDVRFLDFRWDETAFRAIEEGGEHPVGRRSWVLARLLLQQTPLRWEGKLIPVGPALLVLNPSRTGERATLELRAVDMREIFVDLNVIAEPPAGETYQKEAANFRKVGRSVPRLEVTLRERAGVVDLTVHCGDRERTLSLQR